MQLVINISEDVYKRALPYKDEILASNNANDLSELIHVVANGTPLPKGHGRLGDLDALETEIVNGIRAGNYEEGYETFVHINNIDDCVDCVRYADVIIEADGVME